MTAALFDTLEATDVLTAAGIDERRVRALTETVRRAVPDGLATEADPVEIKTELEVDILKAAIAIVVAQTALTAGLLKLPGGAG